MRRICLAVALSLWLTPSAALADDICTYTDWAWHSAEGRAEDFNTVNTRRSELSPEQRHPDLPCSICREDQVEITLSTGDSVTVCHVIAPAVDAALERAVASGFPIESLTGYRVGRTRGPLDARGFRTLYSHHSFGLAIDVNAETNGLYDRCVTWGPSCRLRRGGAWRLGNRSSIRPDGPAYRAMRDIGLKWGGELEGRQKDFMHFSLAGN